LVDSHTKTLSSHVLTLLADTVFARIIHSVSLSEGDCLVALYYLTSTKKPGRYEK